MEQKENVKNWKVRLIAIGIILAVILIAFGAMFLWYRRQIDVLNAQIAQGDEAQIKLHETIKALEEDNDLIIQENSTLEESLDAAMAKIDELLAEPVIVVDAKEFESEIQDISELATIEYRYTNVGIVDGKKQFSFWAQDIPFTEKTAVIVMDGKIKAGIDCKQVSVKCNNLTKKIVVKLPHSSILSNELDEKSLQVVKDEQSIFNKLTQEDHNNLRKQIKDTALENAKKSNVNEIADEKAQNLIRNIIESAPNVKGTYDVEFEYIK